MTNWIYDKTPYVRLQILPKPWKLYTIQDGVDGDIFQICFGVKGQMFFSSTESGKFVTLLFQELIWVNQATLQLVF